MAWMSVIDWVKRTYFRALVLLGRALSIPDSPICRVYNDLGTISYTLLNSHFVIVKEVRPVISKTIGILPIYLTSYQLQAKFAQQLEIKSDKRKKNERRY